MPILGSRSTLTLAGSMGLPLAAMSFAKTAMSTGVFTVVVAASLLATGGILTGAEATYPPTETEYGHKQIEDHPCGGALQESHVFPLSLLKVVGRFRVRDYTTQLVSAILPVSAVNPLNVFHYFFRAA